MAISEVARIREQIEQECKAAKNGLNGLAAVARHDFISARYRRVEELRRQLSQSIGDEEATEMAVTIHNRVMQ